MRKKTERTPGTNGPRHIIHRGLIDKADIPRAESASTECALDILSHRTFRFSGRALSYQNWQFIHHGPLQPVVMPHDA
jgi:hypothetical protein